MKFHTQIANHVQEMLIAKKSSIDINIYFHYISKPEMVMYDKHQVLKLHIPQKMINVVNYLLVNYALYYLLAYLSS